MDREARLRRALLARGTAWPAPLEWHRTLGSTNDVLKARARGGSPEWAAVLADTQTGGRGREGRAWTSPPGGLYLSVLLRPRFEEVGFVPLAAGVAVAEVAGEYGVEARVKWPNDVLVGGAKLAGVLTESSSSSRGVDWVVVGVGVNVAVDQTSFGPLAETAASLHLEADRTPAVEEVAAGVLARLSVWYDALEGRPSQVVDAWRALAIPWWGKPVEVHTTRGVLCGTLRDVDETGALLVDREEGGVQRVLSGEVTRLRPTGSDSRDT
jgi:BirA family biotin operon repressor/biotin-[acetyl-CoA-carboxylase] ligase